VGAYLAQVLQRGRNHDTFVVYRIAQEERPEIVPRFRIASVPALLVAEGGALRARLERPKTAVLSERFLLPWLKVSERTQVCRAPPRSRYVTTSGPQVTRTT
jgi:hypothetical protein